MYQATLQDRAHQLLQDAGAPLSHIDLVIRVLSMPQVKPPLARHLATKLLNGDPRFSYCPRQGWLLSPPPSLRTPLRDVPFTIVDTETTGTANSSRITEIGAVRVHRGRLLARYESLMNAGVPVPANITALTGISQELVDNAPRPEQVIPEFRTFLGQTVIVAHNLPFDLRFIRQEFTLQEQELPQAPSLCTLKLARKLLPLQHFDLGRVASHFRIRVNNRHRALGDAEATARILIQLMKEVEASGAQTLEDVMKLVKNVKISS